MRQAGYVARMGEGRVVLVWRREFRRPLERPSRRWEDIIRMDFREIRIDGANWIWLDQDRVYWRAFVSTIMNLLVPWRKQDIFWQSEWLSAFQIISCTMKKVSNAVFLLLFCSKHLDLATFWRYSLATSICDFSYIFFPDTNIFLVFSVLTSNQIPYYCVTNLLCLCLWYVWFYPIYSHYHHQHRAKFFHSVQSFLIDFDLRKSISKLSGKSLVEKLLLLSDQSVREIRQRFT